MVVHGLQTEADPPGGSGAALPDLRGVPVATLWCILAGSGCYVIGTAFYARKTLPYRYAIWHIWVNLGGIAMFAGVWLALSPLWVTGAS